ncbi:MAG TPA: hypothetical protein VM008_02135 [Phycisphaerae bacterium]|nr:hypothetical protein [Phycisphaerae bacterium]
MKEEQKKILLTSKNATEVKRAAVAAAASDSDADIQMLGDLLATLEFLNRLDSAQDYRDTYTGLRLAQVVNTLADNRRPATDKVLLSLIDAKDYQANFLRIQILIHALAAIRPSPPAAIIYWDKMSVGGSLVAFDVVAALVENESAPAMSLFEKKLVDPKHDLNLKSAWLYQLVLPKRNDEPLLIACEHVLKGSAAGPEVQIFIVEALFDYKPETWYRGCSPVKPPVRLAATREAKDVMVSIGEYALANLKLAPDLKLKVEAALKEVRR